MFGLINLEEELIKENKENPGYQNLLADEARKILADNSKDDLKILKDMGISENFEEGSEINFIKSSLDHSRIFTEDQIKNVCIKYNLRFLPIGMYKGTIDSVLPQKIKEFETLIEATPTKYDVFNYKTNIGITYKRSGYFICAPKESFKLEEKPVDPLLFYPLSNGLYYLNHKWGTDISFTRLITSFPKRNAWCHYFSVMPILTYVLGVLVDIFCKWMGLTDDGIISLIVMAVFGVFGSLIFAGIYSDDYDYSKDTWCKKFK